MTISGQYKQCTHSNTQNVFVVSRKRKKNERWCNSLDAELHRVSEAFCKRTTTSIQQLMCVGVVELDKGRHETTGSNMGRTNKQGITTNKPILAFIGFRGRFVSSLIKSILLNKTWISFDTCFVPINRNKLITSWSDFPPSRKTGKVK